MDGIPRGRHGVRQLEDEPLLDMLVKDRETTQRFAREVLGRVFALPGDDRDTLLATASAWLAARGSAAEAARALYCHENTVRHRLKRLEEHLGSSLDNPRALSDLRTALQAIQAFPDFVAR